MLADSLLNQLTHDGFYNAFVHIQKYSLSLGIKSKFHGLREDLLQVSLKKFSESSVLRVLFDFVDEHFGLRLGDIEA